MEHPSIATPDEVLATFTELMRGDKSAERLKAAEQLAKYHSLFAPKEDAAEPSEAAAAVEAAVAEITKKNRFVPRTSPPARTVSRSSVEPLAQRSQ